MPPILAARLRQASNPANSSSCDARDRQVGLLEIYALEGLMVLLKEIVDDTDLVAALDQLTRDFATDKSRPTSHHDPFAQSQVPLTTRRMS